MAFDLRIQAFAVFVSILAGLGCGLLPAWHVARADVVPALVEDSLAPVGGGLRSRTARVRAVIMAGQVAIAAVLLVGSLLLCRSFYGMLRADVGYDAANVLTATMILPDGDYTPERRLQAVEDVVTRLRVMPGVTNAAYTTATPFSSVIRLSSFTLRKRDGSTRLCRAARGSSAPATSRLSDNVSSKVGNSPIVTPPKRRRSSSSIVNSHGDISMAARSAGRCRTMTTTIDRAGSQSCGRSSASWSDTVRQSITDTAEPEMFYLARSQPLKGEQCHWSCAPPAIHGRSSALFGPR